MEILTNKDKVILDDVSDSEFAMLSAKYLMERGYPVIYTDQYKLEQDILEKLNGKQSD